VSNYGQKVLPILIGETYIYGWSLIHTVISKFDQLLDELVSIDKVGCSGEVTWALLASSASAAFDFFHSVQRTKLPFSEDTGSCFVQKLRSKIIRQ
jgi:hypothetical protein